MSETIGVDRHQAFAHLWNVLGDQNVLLGLAIAGISLLYALVLTRSLRLAFPFPRWR